MSSPLCVACQAIPLEPGLKTLTQPGHSGRLTWDLGSFGEVRRRSCPFCELVASICTKSFTSWDPLAPPLDATKINVTWLFDGFTASGQSPIGSYVCMAGQLDQNKPYCARLQFPEWIDFDDVRRWILTCEENHPTTEFPECRPATFNPSVLPRNSRRQLDFRLIDVDSMCIVYAPRQCRYIALSYVWGQRNNRRLVLTSDNEEALMEQGGLAREETRTSIPNTILDAMSVVRKLGERYLWVDSLCLLQDEANELQDCVAIMDLFYEMAVLTIVAASGEDAWSGLPGVSPTPRRLSRLVREIKPGLKMTTIMDVETLLRRTIYSSRAWTMQEEILSNRLLIFINGQVYFQCPRGLFSEAMNWPGRKLINIQHSASLYSTIFSNSDADFRDFSTVITYYMSRKFTYQNDVLRAAEGMLRKFSVLSQLHCFEGLPPPLDRSLLFDCVHYPISQSFDRREGFPSYSWTGWKYAACYDGRIEKADNLYSDDLADENKSGLQSNLRSWITWHCLLEDGKRFRIDNIGRLRKSPFPKAEDSLRKARRAFQKIAVSVSDVDFTGIRAKSYPILMFWTICVNLRLRYRPNFREVENRIQTPSFNVIDRLGATCGSVTGEFTLKGSEQKFAIVASDETHFWALLLVWEDDIAERRGVARLPMEILETCLPPGPRWKAIVLG